MGVASAVMEPRPVDRSRIGLLPGLNERIPNETALAIFRQACLNRAFEMETARVHQAGAIKMPVYLSVGQEIVPAAISAVSKEFLIFAQHRAHSYYLSFGGN